METQLIRAMQFYHLARRGGALIASVLLVKWGLETSSIGGFETWIYLVMLSSFFWVESLIKAFLSVYDQGKAQAKGSATLYWMFLGVALLIAGLFGLFENLVETVFTGGQEVPEFSLFLIYLVLLPSLSVIPFHHQVHRQVNWIWIWGFFVLLGYPLVMGLGLYQFGNLRGVILGMIGFAGVGHLWAWWSILRTEWGGWWQSPLVRKIWRVGWPLVLYAVIQSLTVVVDSALVQGFYKDLSQFAIFRYGARELPLVVPLIAGVVNLALPALVRSWDEGLEMIVRHSQRLMHLLFPLVFIIMALSGWLFEVVYSEEYRASAAVFNVYLLLIIPQMLFPQTLITAKGENGILVYVGIVEVGFNVAWTWALLHSWGMVGVAWATFMAFCLEKFLLILFVRRRYLLDWRDYTAWKPWLLYSSVLIIFAIYQSFIG